MFLTGQSTLEYSVLIFCLVAACLSMQVYLKRAMQGRLRQAADELGEQYAPKNTTGISTLTTTGTTETISKTLSESQLSVDLDGDGIIEDDVFGTETKAAILEDEKSQQAGEEKVGELESSLFE